MKLQEHFNLKEYNTFGIDARCRFFIETKSASDINMLMLFRSQNKYPLLFLGGGSNILFTKDFPGGVIKMSSRGIEKKKETGEYVFVTAQAGELWDDFVSHCVEQGWAGVENLSLIPGTVGAAPIQNIGAYGVEVKDSIESVRIIELPSGKERWLYNEDCRFSYRDSIFKNELKDHFIILEVTFRLRKTKDIDPYRSGILCLDYGDISRELNMAGILHPGLKDVRDTVIRIRRSKLPEPSEIGNAGSFFKNPVIQAELKDELIVQFPLMPCFENPGGFKVPAAWLIEQCGWKGKRLGNAGVNEKQPLVLVNYGNATGLEILELAEAVRNSVEVKFGIRLEFEVNIL
jgi:UDP-N-acetylmuramate dehydrogenase